MRIPGVKTAKLFSKWLQGRIFGGALILGYHRVTQTISDDFDIRVTPDHFREHLEVLRQHTRPIPLSELVHHLQQGSIPRKTVAVTFDDGYVDNLVSARPLLEQYQIPATFFISTDYLGKEFWWDEIKRLVMAPTIPPQSLRILVQGEWVAWNASEGFEQAPETKRTALVKWLYARLFPLDKEARGDAMQQLREWFETQVSTDDHRAMTTDELLALVEGKLIDVGSHTLTHPILTHLSIEKQREEICNSKVFLEDLFGRTISGFSYPHGKFSAETQAIVRDAGYQYACCSQKELARNLQQRYALPRLWPKDWDGETFARYLQLWIGG